MKKSKRIHQILTVAGYNFRQWRRNPRVYITFVLAFILCYLLSDKVVAFAEKYQLSTQILEPFIWTYGDSDSILLSSLLLIFLFADMPFLSAGTPFYLMRTTRRIWLTGQIVYIAAATFLYVGFTLISTSLVCWHNSYPGNLWSPTAAMLGYSSAGETIAVPAAVKSMEMTLPWMCAARIFLLMLFYVMMLVFVMLVFNIWKGQIAGLISAFVFCLYGFLLSPDIVKLILHLSDVESYKANVIVGWLSPLNQATYHMHNFGYDLLPTLGQTYLIYLSLIVMCFLTADRLVRRYNFSFVGTSTLQ